MSMGKRANPTLIGAFVVGAAALAVGGVAYFGGGHLFAEHLTYVAFFEGSLKGLQVGAPVTFRGVRIGEVSDIVVRYDGNDRSVRIVVQFQIDRDRIRPVRERKLDPHENIKALIGDGLRAQLVMQSFVTGQVAIQLDFYEQAPLILVGSHEPFPEFPTIPSASYKLGKALEDFDVDGLLDDIRSAMAGIEDLATSQKLRDAIASLDETIRDFGKLARDVNGKVEPISTQIDETAVAARRALDRVSDSVFSVETTLNPALEDARRLIQNIDGQVQPTVAAFRQTAETAQAALEEAKRTLAVARGNLAEDSELYRSVVSALDELASAARSIRVLADLLERHPEALLQGKSNAGG